MEQKKEKAGLVLEGGSRRGVFTAGVLDYFMEQGVSFPYVIGVSAGSCNAIDYVSEQPLRTKRCMIDFLRAGKYFGVRNLPKQKSIMDMDLIFDILPNGIIPFDYETYFQSDKECTIVTTNCLTGKAEYLTERHSKKRLLNIVRASCSLPIISPPVYVDGIPMLDGGMADSIPLVRARKDGCTKAVLVLTRNKGYRKEAYRKTRRAAEFLYGRKYPHLVHAIKIRHKRYNKTLEYIEKLEEAGKIFVIRPQKPVVRSMEKSPDILQEFYEHGYEYAKEVYPEMMEYLKKDVLF